MLIGLQKIHFNKATFVTGTFKAGRLTRQTGRLADKGGMNRCARFNCQNIIMTAANRSNSHKDRQYVPLISLLWIVYIGEVC